MDKKDKGGDGKKGGNDAGEAEPQRDALGRRVWDKAEYEKRAQDRAAEEGDSVTGAKRGTILAVKRENLKEREKKVDLTSRVGKSRTVESAHGAGSGYYCKVRCWR